MDFVSHGLWGGITLGRKNKKTFWQAFLISIAPDVLSFGTFFLLIILGFIQRPNFGVGPHDPSSFPSLIYIIYNVTHSFVIFALVFLVLYLIFKKPFWLLLVWGLHIFLDIFTHSFEFFPTPFLWPISDFKLDLWAWGDGNLWIYIPNIAFLIFLYSWFFIVKRRRKLKKGHKQRNKIFEIIK